MRSVAFALLIVFCAFSASCGACGMKKFGRGVALVELKGVIIEPDDIIEDLEEARTDDDVKAVVVRVDSPGGSVGASQEIFHAVQELDKIKPVVISMGDVAASGGYYVSAGARKIFANSGTITGSIGVRMEHLDIGELMAFMKLKPEILKSGKYKDIGSAYRAMTPEERQILDALLAELHEQFKNDVAMGRKLEKKKVDEFADGRVFTGATAKGMGLVDELGGMLDARAEAAKLAGLKGEVEFIKMRDDEPWWLNFVTEKVSSLLGVAGQALFKPFVYQWRL